MTIVYEPIFKLLRKNQLGVWNDRCQQAFEAIKRYLMKPPILQPSRPEKPLILYLAIEKEAVGAMLAQEDGNRVEHVVYYLSKKFLPYEVNYNLVEKTCLSVV